MKTSTDIKTKTYSNVEVMHIINDKMREIGFTRKRLGDGWIIYHLGDNHFNLTKRFARFEIRRMGKKLMLSGHVAHAVKSGDRVSHIDWAGSCKVSDKDFANVAIKMMKELIVSMRTEPGKFGEKKTFSLSAKTVKLDW